MEYSFEPLLRWDAYGAFIDEHNDEGDTNSSCAKFCPEHKGSQMSDCTGNTELTWDPVHRYNALTKVLKEPRGAKTTEHLENLRLSDPAFGSLVPAKERVGVHELPYDPVRRFHAMAPSLKVPRGAKTTEHLENLRLSDPAYGSLVPAKERVGVHELPYDPVRRFHAMAPSLKVPRGAKTTEHLENLRHSCPSYGSLRPLQERVGIHEYAYEPVRRYVALAKIMDTAPRGAKSLEHLENLRINDPSYGSLVPLRSHQVEEEWCDVGSGLSSSEGSGEEGAHPKRSSSGRLPRILSNQILHFSDDEDEDAAAFSPLSMASETPRRPVWAPPSPKRNPAFFPPSGFMGTRGFSLYGDGERDSERDDASLRSMARTSRASVERSSNDTITSFLDDADPNASGEFNSEAMRQAIAGEGSSSKAPPPEYGRTGRVPIPAAKSHKFAKMPNRKAKEAPPQPPAAADPRPVR